MSDLPDVSSPPFKLPKDSISFFVPGIPTAFARTRTNKAGSRFTPDKQRAEMAAIRLFGQRAMAGRAPFDCAMKVEIWANFPYPQSWSVAKRYSTHWKNSKPDSSNIQKLAEDALNGVVWIDDARIVDCRVVKTYGDRPGIRIIAEAIS